MTRRIDVLTLGLSAQSRFNPLYRWWARRRVEQAISVGLKALLDLHGELFLGPQAYADASKIVAVAVPEEGGVRYRVLGYDDKPQTTRILWKGLRG